MSLKIKRFTDIVASMLNYIYYSDVKLTDYNVGSSLRGMVGAVAMELEELYYRLWDAIQDAIKSSILQTFDFIVADGTPAQGTVTFKREIAATEDYTIPAGTEVMSAEGIKYKTVVVGTLATGQTEVTLSIAAVRKGANTNILEIGAAMQMVNPVLGVSTVETATPISGGTDSETTEELKERFSMYVNALTRSTLGSLEYAATLAAYGTESVHKVLAVDYVGNKGYIDVYIDDGTGAASATYTEITGATPTRVTDDYQFTLDGDWTPQLTPWKQMEIVVSAVTYYTEIVSAVYAGGTTTVKVSDAVITTDPTTVKYLSAGLIHEVRKHIDGYTLNDVSYDGYKAAGSLVTVSAVTPVDCYVKITVESDNFDVVKPFIEQAVDTYLADLDFGEDVDYERIISLIFNAHTDVLRVTEVLIEDVNPPTVEGDLAIAASERAIKQSLTVVEG